MPSAEGLVGWGFARGRSADRYVEVKGLAEREVTADLALWPLRFVAGGNDLATAQAQITRSYEQVLEFLKRNGIDESASIFRTFRYRTPRRINISAKARNRDS